MPPELIVVMYHYIRDLPRTRFPRIKGMPTNDFRHQVASLSERYEMATLESALAFLIGRYRPTSNLCLLTFDDGLKDHYTDVFPVLAEKRIQGLFFVITSCLEEHCLAPVHMNHFLMATLDFEVYQRAFMQRLTDFAPNVRSSPEVNATVAQRTYRWDTPEVASFKFLFNFALDWSIRDQVVKTLFEENIANEQSFAHTLYLKWEEARQMQAAGMLIGGHSHQHRPLATLSDEELRWDLNTCHELLAEHLQPQSLWPFSYPYGKKDSFGDVTIRQLKRHGFTSSFCTEVGVNLPGMDAFALRRIDCKDALKE